MKVLRIQLLRLAWIGVLAGGAIGCQPKNLLPFAWSSPPVVSVGEISQRRGDRIVSLKGRVIDRVPFIDSGSYQIQDATGTVWVLTNKPLPKIGEEVVIKGQIEYQPIPIGSKDLGEFYILELEQLAAAPTSSTPTAPQPDKVAMPSTQPVIEPSPQLEVRPPEGTTASSPPTQPPLSPPIQPETKPLQPETKPPTLVVKPSPDLNSGLKPSGEPPSLNLNELYFPHKRNSK